jgi:hypothetical protein
LVVRQHGEILRQARCRNDKGLQMQARRESDIPCTGQPDAGFAGSSCLPPGGKPRSGAREGYFVLGFDLNRSNGSVNLIGTPMRLLMNDCCKMVRMLFVTQ